MPNDHAAFRIVPTLRKAIRDHRGLASHHARPAAPLHLPGMCAKTDDAATHTQAKRGDSRVSESDTALFVLKLAFVMVMAMWLIKILVGWK